MARRAWISVLVMVAVTALTADQAQPRRPVPFGSRGIDTTEDSLVITNMGSEATDSKIMRILHLDEGGWETGPTTPGLTFWHPQDFVLDATGRLHVTDRGNRRIVSMDDVAGRGWVALSAAGGNQLAEPGFVNGVESDTGVYGLALDAAGRLYTTSAKPSRLIRVDSIGGGGWRTFDSGGSQTFAARDVALDGQGRIYLTDNRNHRILRIDDISGSGLATFGTVGRGVGQLKQPNGVTVDAAGRIYIADEDNNRIVRINDMTGAGWTTFGTYGSGSGNLDTPHSTSIDAAGRIWIADTGNRRIVRINSMAGDGFTSFGTRELQGRGLNLSATKYLQVVGRGPTVQYPLIYPHVTVGSGVQASLIGVNLESAPVAFSVSFGTTANAPCPGDGLSDCGAPVTVTVDGVSSEEFTRTVAPMGAARLDLTATGDQTVAYGRMRASGHVAGAVLLQAMQAGTVTGETIVHATPASDRLVVYVDERNGARTAYSLVNPMPFGPAIPGANYAQVSVIVRHASGRIVGSKTVNVFPGRALVEFAAQAFPETIGPGFEGTIEFTTRSGGRQKFEVVALRYEAGDAGVLTSLPVLLDVANDQTETSPGHRPVAGDQTTTRHFPHIADGASYRTNFFVVNPFDTATTAHLEFFGVDGRRLAVSLGGAARTTFSLSLGPRGAASVTTDGSAPEVAWGWARMTASQRVDGAAIVQRVSDGRIAAEGAIPSSRLARRLIAYVNNTGSTESGIAISNPNDRLVSATFTLRNSDGDALQATTATLPPFGYVAQLTRQLFPGFEGMEGTIDVESNGPPIAAVGLRYDNPGGTVFTTMPVSWLP